MIIKTIIKYYTKRKALKMGGVITKPGGSN